MAVSLDGYKYCMNFAFVCEQYAVSLSSCIFVCMHVCVRDGSCCHPAKMTVVKDSKAACNGPAVTSFPVLFYFPLMGFIPLSAGSLLRPFFRFLFFLLVPPSSFSLPRHITGCLWRTAEGQRPPASHNNVVKQAYR